MGSGYDLEEAEKKADYTEHEYDRDEDALQHGKDTLSDHVEHLAKMMKRRNDATFHTVQARFDDDDHDTDSWLQQKLNEVHDATSSALFRNFRTVSSQESSNLSAVTLPASSSICAAL